MITATQQKAIENTFQLVRPRADEAGKMFYDRLFALDPELEGFFHRKPIEEQGGKLMQVLAYVVDHLDELPLLRPTIEEMGRQHRAFGVVADHYATVGNALLITLHFTLAEKLDEEAEAAWIELYTTLAQWMEDAAGA